MAKKTSKKEEQGPVIKFHKVQRPELPSDFQGAQYANKLTVAASAQEVFLDLFQLGPGAGGDGESSAIFVGRFIFPLMLAKELISDLHMLVERIESDTGLTLPEPEEMEE